MLKIDLSGRVALVTGGSGELGRAMCRTLADCGAAVAVHYHGSQEKAGRVVSDIATSGGRAMAVQADVTDPDEVTRMAAGIRGALGEPDIVIANAVIQYEWTSIIDQPLSDFDSQYESCVKQSVMLAKEFVPAMQAKGWGRFVAINTECAMQCGPGMGAYVSGKRGLDGVVRVLAREVGKDGVTVNQVAPGWIASDKVIANPDDVQAGYRERVPLKRAGTDQEIANVVAFLASDLASFITGAYVPVCGGNVMPAI